MASTGSIYRINNNMVNDVQRKNIVAETISAILVSKNFTEASDLLEIDRSTLYKRFKSHPEIKDVASAVQEYSQDALKLASAKAVNVLIRGLESPSITIRMDSAKEILDRIGITKTNPSIINMIQNKPDIPEPLLIKFTDFSDKDKVDNLTLLDNDKDNI